MVDGAASTAHERALLVRGNPGSPSALIWTLPSGRKQTNALENQPPWSRSPAERPARDPRAAHPHCRGVAIFRHARRTIKHSGPHRTQSKRTLVKYGRSTARRRSRVAVVVRCPPAGAAVPNVAVEAAG